MVKVKFELAGGETLVLKLSGHAGYAPEGNDTICAAASVLAYTAAQEVLEMQKNGKLRKAAHIKLDKGECLITCKPIDDARSEALRIYMVVQTGYRLLAENFPAHIQLDTF